VGKAHSSSGLQHSEANQRCKELARRIRGLSSGEGGRLVFSFLSFFMVSRAVMDEEEAWK